MAARKSATWLLLLGLMAIWFASTWSVSLFALKESSSDGDGNVGIAASPGRRRRNAKDLSTYFKKKEGKQKQAMLQRERARNQPMLPLTAYLEGPLPPYDPHKTVRLPSRTPGTLKQIVYDQIGTTCRDFPNAFPVLVPTIDDAEPSDCPIWADPFLPWIHDAFIDQSFTSVEFIAHNQRRCHTDPKKYFRRLSHLEPQAILFQSVPIKKLGNRQYQLTSMEQADVKETRFLCLFHDANKEAIGETLSTFPYNYEHANYQKRNTAPLLSRPQHDQDGKTALHNEQVWNSLLHFQCPIPNDLKASLRHSTVGGIPAFYVDLVPIRTYGRLDRGGYFDRASRKMKFQDVTFDPILEWGDRHILPPVEQSGRWANIPLCPANWEGDAKPIQQEAPQRYFLTACVWASASFMTRTASAADTSTSERLLEWLTYQLYMAGFDHIYIYDNSSPKGTQNLESVTSLFPSDKVTRIPWKHPVCNNKPPGSPDPGERSSQYAAEASCRIRFGSLTKWMAILDIDEYFIPQPPYSSIREWLQHKYHSDGDDTTKILSFYQTRAVPNREYLDPIVSPDGKDLQYQWRKKPTTTYLETYNCDRTAFPKPSFAWRAKKQIFQPSYVLMHFVHYSLVTQRLLEHPTEPSGQYNVHPPYEMRVDERTEAYLLHTKTTPPPATQYWRKHCRDNKDNACPIGLPIPPGVKEGSVNEEGMRYNCYVHDRISDEIVPRLKSLLAPFQVKYRASLTS